MVLSAPHREFIRARSYRPGAFGAARPSGFDEFHVPARPDLAPPELCEDFFEGVTEGRREGLPPYNLSLITDTTPTLIRYTQDAIQLFSRPQVYVMDNAT